MDHVKEFSDLILPAGSSSTMKAENCPVLPGLGAMGYGYNVEGQYANTHSCTQSLFDFGPNDSIKTVSGGKSYAFPSKAGLSILEMNESIFTTVSGKDIASYSESLNTSTSLKGNYGFFSASLDIDYNSEQQSNTENEFVTIRNIIQLWSIKLPSIDQLKNLLRPEVKADLEGQHAVTCEDVFNKYGTHFVKEAIIGGRSDYSSSINKSTFKDIKELTIAAKMSYESLNGSLSAENKTKHKTEINTFQEKANTSIRTVGGNPVLGGQNVLNGAEKFSEWAASVPDYATLTDFNDSSLVEIWELCDDEARKKEFKAAYDKYMAFKLELEWIDSSKLVVAASFKGSGSHKHLRCYKPAKDALSDGYYWLTQLPTQLYDSYPSYNPKLPVVKANRKEALAPPVGFTCIWRGNHHYSVWRPIPPQGYVSMGDIVKKNDYKIPPKGDEIEGLMCIHKDLVKLGKCRNSVYWNDHGTSADLDGSAFQIKSTNADEMITFNGLLAIEGYPDKPPKSLNGLAYCLNKKDVKVVD